LYTKTDGKNVSFKTQTTTASSKLSEISLCHKNVNEKKGRRGER